MTFPDVSTVSNMTLIVSFLLERVYVIYQVYEQFLLVPSVELTSLQLDCVESCRIVRRV